MAYTANTGFRYFSTLNAGTPTPIARPYLIGNSKTLRVGDAVRIDTSGLCVTAGAGNPIAGVIVGFVDNNGIPVNGFGVTNTTGATFSGDDVVVTASDNTSRASAVYAQVVLDPSGNILWLNKSDGSLALTNLFQLFDNDSNSRQIATGGASDSSGQWQLIELDPESKGGAATDATKGLFRIAEPQLMNFHANGDSDLLVALNAA
jgi:hypothetical protein